MLLKESFQVYSDSYLVLELTLEVGGVPSDNRLISLEDETKQGRKEVKRIQTKCFAGALYEASQNQHLIFETKEGTLSLKGQLQSEKEVQDTDILLFEKLLNSVYLIDEK